MTNNQPLTNNQPRRGPGPPLGNQNAFRHGRRSAQAVLSRKLGRARLKGLAHMGLATWMFLKGFLPNPRPIRSDQIALLQSHDPEIAAYLATMFPDVPGLPGL
jgi:hypothetical protein